MENQEDTLYNLFSKIIRQHYHLSHMIFEKEGIYPGQPPLLVLLCRCNGQSQKELADKLKIAPATINVMVKRMEKSGLLKKKKDEVDQRASRIYLTNKGTEASLKVKDSIRFINERCFANFTVEESVLLRRFMMQMIDNLKETIEMIDS